MALRAQLLVDLRAKAVDEDDLDAHRLQDRQVLGERGELAAAISSPAMATTKVLPWYAWMCGATVRNHGTKVCGKTRFTGVGAASERAGAILAWHRRGRPREAALARQAATCRAAAAATGRSAGNM
jgi:hypothetical protein